MVSDPEYDVAVHFDRMVAMRDGTRLATDVYRPADETGQPVDDPMPALLVRTPYDKRDRDRLEHQGRWYAERGYVVAIQDCRGRYASEGSFYFLLNEPEDGYDTVEWLADQPYCDGQVGTMGTSYMAWVQTALAALDPPALAAMFVHEGGANGWEATLRHNGTIELKWLTWALTTGGGFAKRCLANPDVQRRLAAVDTRDVFAAEPVTRGQSPLRHIPEYERWFFDFALAGGDDERWDSPAVNVEAHYNEMADVPTVYAGGWYDSYAKATCDNFVGLADRKDADHYLIMGPWTHGYGYIHWQRPVAGELHLGADAVVDYNETRRRFFDHYLKGRDTWDEPRVQYFRMGTGSGAAVGGDRIDHGGEWAAAADWPLPETEFTAFYTHGDGSLTTEPPTASASVSRYEFDPRNPVPTIGGNCSSYYTFEPREEPIEDLPLAQRETISVTGRGGIDQRTRPDTLGADPPYGPLEARNDVLVFRSPSLESPVEIAGPITVTVYASTDAPDTDFTAKLIDEYPPSPDFPEGFALNLADSICRARYRGSRRDVDFVEPGEIYEFTIQPYPTATVFQTGHRIRLDISSSNYPRYDVNHNTGGPLYGGREYRVATNTVYHQRDHPTHVELPLQPSP